LDDELAEFVRGRYPELVRRAHLLIGSRSSAEDLVQEALARCCAAWRRRPVTTPNAYVQRVMVNLMISKSRRRRLREDAAEIVPDVGINEGMAEQADRDLLWRALRQTAPRQRAALVLRFYEDMSEADIAECLKVTVGTVRSQTAKVSPSFDLRRRRGEGRRGSAADVGRQRSRRHVDAAARAASHERDPVGVCGFQGFGGVRSGSRQCGDRERGPRSARFAASRSAPGIGPRRTHSRATPTRSPPRGVGRRVVSTTPTTGCRSPAGRSSRANPRYASSR